MRKFDPDPDSDSDPDPEVFTGTKHLITARESHPPCRLARQEEEFKHISIRSAQFPILPQGG